MGWHWDSRALRSNPFSGRHEMRARAPEVARSIQTVFRVGGAGGGPADGEGGREGGRENGKLNVGRSRLNS